MTELRVRRWLILAVAIAAAWTSAVAGQESPDRYAERIEAAQSGSLESLAR